MKLRRKFVERNENNFVVWPAVKKALTLDLLFDALVLPRSDGNHLLIQISVAFKDEIGEVNRVFEVNAVQFHEAHGDVHFQESVSVDKLGSPAETLRHAGDVQFVIGKKIGWFATMGHERRRKRSRM